MTVKSASLAAIAVEQVLRGEWRLLPVVWSGRVCGACRRDVPVRVWGRRLRGLHTPKRERLPGFRLLLKQGVGAFLRSGLGSIGRRGVGSSRRSGPAIDGAEDAVGVEGLHEGAGAVVDGFAHEMEVLSVFITP